MKKFVASWSGGKDSCYAMMQAIAQGYIPAVLLNMMNENGLVSRSHAIPKSILRAQGASMNLPIIMKPTSWEDYEQLFIKSLIELKATDGIAVGVFGDIDLQAHRDWEEKVCKTAGLEASLPLWKRNRKELVLEMISSGIEAYIVSCNEAMGEEYLGEKITETLLGRLEETGVDACGENGEYHTLVVNAPLFRKKLNVGFGIRSCYKNYWFTEMELL